VDAAELNALRQTFVAETSDHLDELEAALTELEAHPGDRARIQQILQIAHTFKGTAGSLGYKALSEIGHAMEDVIEDLARRGAPAIGPVVFLLLEGADAARQMLSDALAGIDRLPPTAGALLRRLRSPDRQAPREQASSSQIKGSSRDEVTSMAARQRTVRVDVAKLDRMVDLIGEIAVGRSRIGQRVRELGGPDGAALLEDLEQTELLYAELEEVIRTARMVPVGPWLRQYASAVRDVARADGKEARLVIEGGDVEVDMAVLERLRDPLTHLVRNAVGHGIEPPEVRRARGKEPSGTITLSAWYEGGGIALRIADDGAGLCRAQIAAQARARGSALDPEALSAEALHRLVFEPGFSTAADVSDLSGRGVGLSAVRQRIEALRGSIRIESAEGAKASFTIRLPLTLATIEGLSVEIDQERYVVPLETVVECVDIPEGELADGGRCMINLRGRALPCISLRELFDLEGPAPPRQSVVVVRHDEGLGGLVVDALHGEGRTVIKPLGRLFRGIPGVAGSTILGDGRVALILDVATLLRDVAPRRARSAVLHR
jgi:two-component system, chemotaxis family, sensor kinase CheA